MKPLTKAEWERVRPAHVKHKIHAGDAGGPSGDVGFMSRLAKKMTEDHQRIVATLDALFEYRERTRLFKAWNPETKDYLYADLIAGELGFE